MGLVLLDLVRPPHLPLVDGDGLDLHRFLLLATALHGPKSLQLVALGRVEQELLLLEAIDSLQEVPPVRGVL